MSSPDCKRQKLAGDVNSVAEMTNVSPKKDCGCQTGDGTTTASTSNEKCIFDKDAQSFKEVASSDGFVDRTMLIKELLEHKPTKVMIFAPSKFGKTINLDMIRLFCDIEDKNTKTKEDVAKDPTMHELRENPSENMKVFLRQFEGKKYEECLILKQEKFVIKHFGRHPVISFDFKDCSPRNESRAIKACALQVKEGYLENKYLKKSKEFQSDDDHHIYLKQACTDWCSYTETQLENLDGDDVKNGLKNLIKSLRIHWGRDPVFLVDEVDKPCVDAMQEGLSAEQVRKIGKVVSDVVCSILKEGKEKLRLQAALVTGISKFRNSGLSPLDNTMTIYFLSDARFSKYYGLTDEEVKSLVKKFYKSEKEMATIIKDINTNYNGYYQCTLSGGERKPIEHARYCIFSVLGYLQQKNVEKESLNLRFWNERFIGEEFISALKKSDTIMNDIQKLMCDDSGTIAIKHQQEIKVGDLIGIYQDGINPGPNATFNFFLQRGILAHNIKKPVEKVENEVIIHVRIPNLEIKLMYKEMFESYHSSLPFTVQSALTSCGEFFKSLPTLLESSMQNPMEFQEDPNFLNDLDKLCENLKCIFSLVKCQSEASVCSYILTILKLYAKYEKGELNYSVQYVDDKGKQNRVHIDLWGQHGDFALILEAKHNVTANGELGKIGCKTKSSLAAAEDIVERLPGKEDSEDKNCSKAGTGKNLKVLDPTKIKKYLLIGLAVDGDGSNHMLVFRNNSDWKNVIQVNPESYVKELISKHLESNN